LLVWTGFYTLTHGPGFGGLVWLLALIRSGHCLSLCSLLHTGWSKTGQFYAAAAFLITRIKSTTKKPVEGIIRKQPDGCIVWNVHNTVFGSTSTQSYIIYCLSPFRHVSILTFAVLVCRRFEHTTKSSGHAHLDHQRRVVSLVNGRRTSQRIWWRFLVRNVLSSWKTLNWF